MPVTAGFRISIRPCKDYKENGMYQQCQAESHPKTLASPLRRRPGTTIPSKTVGNISDCNSLNKDSHLIPMLKNQNTVVSTKGTDQNIQRQILPSLPNF